MHVATERARALSYFAALTIAADDPRRRLAAAMAKASAGEAQAAGVGDGLQLFGAMGFDVGDDFDRSGPRPACFSAVPPPTGLSIEPRNSWFGLASRTFDFCTTTETSARDTRSRSARSTREGDGSRTSTPISTSILGRCRLRRRRHAGRSRLRDRFETSPGFRCLVSPVTPGRLVAVSAVREVAASIGRQGYAGRDQGLSPRSCRSSPTVASGEAVRFRHRATRSRTCLRLRAGSRAACDARLQVLRIWCTALRRGRGARGYARRLLPAPHFAHLSAKARPRRSVWLDAARQQRRNFGHAADLRSRHPHTPRLAKHRHDHDCPRRARE